MALPPSHIILAVRSEHVAQARNIILNAFLLVQPTVVGGWKRNKEEPYTVEASQVTPDKTSAMIYILASTEHPLRSKSGRRPQTQVTSDKASAMRYILALTEYPTSHQIRAPGANTTGTHRAYAVREHQSWPHHRTTAATRFGVFYGRGILQHLTFLRLWYMYDTWAPT